MYVSGRAASLLQSHSHDSPASGWQKTKRLQNQVYGHKVAKRGGVDYPALMNIAFTPLSLQFLFSASPISSVCTSQRVVVVVVGGGGSVDRKVWTKTRAHAVHAVNRETATV